MSDIEREVAHLEGAAALPRRNGELVFASPWEGRAFGMAMLLLERGAYHWDEFRDRLIERIGGQALPYYESWLGALEALAVERGLVSAGDLEARAAEFRELRRDPIL